MIKTTKRNIKEGQPEGHYLKEINSISKVQSVSIDLLCQKLMLAHLFLMVVPISSTKFTQLKQALLKLISAYLSMILIN